MNQICGTQIDGSPGEVNLGGPNWPSAGSSDLESEEACAVACSDRKGCTHYNWFNDKGCRTSTNCNQTVSFGWNIRSFICEKGISKF